MRSSSQSFRGCCSAAHSWRCGNVAFSLLCRFIFSAAVTTTSMFAWLTPFSHQLGHEPTLDTIEALVSAGTNCWLHTILHTLFVDTVKVMKKKMKDTSSEASPVTEHQSGELFLDCLCVCVCYVMPFLLSLPVFPCLCGGVSMSAVLAG